MEETNPKKQNKLTNLGDGNNENIIDDNHIWINKLIELHTIYQ